jgi:hypothetical protein
VTPNRPGSGPWRDVSRNDAAPVGVKMLISPVVHLPVWVSLAVIVVVAGGAMAASLWRDRNGRRQAPEQRGLVRR